ncbi:hypothetical protein GGR57DRAFT_486652 [Xylariaceae sp. FL1272]|nr:hypothetical protein GGR57DRAFT_486652 [Xylariaceae sp. FL1272]
MSISSFFQRSRRGLSSTASIAPVHRGDDASTVETGSPRRFQAPRREVGSIGELDYMDVLNAATELELPSIELRRADVVQDEEQQTILLGSGLTSNVVQYVMTDQDPIETPTGRIVALKTFTRRSSSKVARQAVYETIVREMGVLRHPLIIGHPNIVQLHFMGWRKAEPFPALAMEHGAHGSLDYLIRSSWAGLSDDQIHATCCHITIDIAMGLHAIHRAGYVHGDLKPENILVMSHDSEARRVIAKLTDFGGSSPHAGEQGEQPVHFTPLWSAPEVLNQDPDVDWERADVYSFGLVVGSLWASIPETGGFGSGRLSRASSCFLVSFTQATMSQKDEEDMLWYLKTSPDTTSGQSINSLLQDKLKVALPGNEHLVTQISQVLTPVLKAYFWTRPVVEDVGHSLTDLAGLVERDIRQEMAAPPQRDARSREKQKLGPFSWTRSRDYFSILVEQATLALDERSVSDRDMVAQIDVPEVLPENYNAGKYLKQMADVVKHLAFGKAGGETAEGTEARWKDKGRRATLSRFIAFSSLAASKTPSTLKTLQDMTYTSAMAGDGATICLAALMFVNTPKESELPIRCFLSLLALSRSNQAAQLLHARWPHHYEMVQDMMRLKPSALVKAASQIAPNSSPYMLETLTSYSREPIVKRALTLKEALDMGLLGTMRDILEGQMVLEDMNLSVAGLLHGLSSLPDTEATALVPKALEMGAKLSFLAPTGSSISASGFFQDDRDGEQSLSPLAAAIRRGKSALALAILNAHVETAKEPIIDFDECLALSCTYLQHELADALMYLHRTNPSICQKCQKFQTDAETVLWELALDVIDPERSPRVELERRLLFGPEHNVAYEKTLNIILERIADPSAGSIETSLLVNAIRLDDLVAVRQIVEVLERKGFNVYQRLKHPSNRGTDPEEEALEITTLDICVFFDAVQSFEYLLQRFPSFSSEIFPESGSTLLHEACSGKASVRFVEALLRYGADGTIKNDRGQTPLCEALSKGNIEAADAIARHLSYQGIEGAMAKNKDDGWSLCFQLLASWSKYRQPELVKSFQWLAEHQGLHHLGPNEVPSWYPVVGNPRPHSSGDQRLCMELLKQLMGKHELEARVSTERWENKTILHHAVWNGHIKVVEMLLDKDIDVDIGVEYSGKLPENIPTHLFDPSKDRPTALDMVCLKIGGFDIPPEVLKGGFIEVQKWTEDLEQIRDLLIEKGGKSKVLEGIMGLDSDHPQAQQASRLASTSYLRDGQALTGVWPKPVAKTTTSITPKTTREDILADSQMRDEAFHNVMRSQLQKREMERRREREKEITPADYLETIRAGAKLRRYEWRLPPGWHCLSINEDNDDERGGVRILYMNRDTGDCTYNRPELFRGPRSRQADVHERLRQIPNNALDQDGSPNLTRDDTSSNLDLSNLSLDSPRLPVSTAQNGPGVKDQVTTSDSQSIGDDFFTTRTEGGLIQLPRNFMHLKLDDGSNWLHMAAIGGKADFLESMLEQNLIPIDSEQHDGCTPLHTAVDEGALEVLELLLKHGADPNRTFPRRGHRPLHHSLLQDNTNMANILIKGGADVNGTTVEGYTPLHFCMATGDKPEFIDVLLNANADINATCREGTALRMAVSYGHRQSVAKLLDAGARADNNDFLLHAAARQGDVEIATRLLDAGLDVNKRTESQWTPIIDAVVYENFEMLRLLCERGADISVLAEEFKFFVRRRDDGKIDRMGLHVGKDGPELTADVLNEEMPEENRGWEVWEPVRITKAKDRDDAEEDDEEQEEEQDSKKEGSEDVA